MTKWPPLYVDDSQVDDSHVALEQAVMDLLLAGDDPVLDALRDQYRLSRIGKRLFSGVGFVTDFVVPRDVAAVNAQSLFFLSDVRADLNNVPGAAGFHAQVKNGRLKLLEGFTFEGSWPSAFVDFKVYYRYPPAAIKQHPNHSPSERLMDYVREQWQKT